MYNWTPPVTDRNLSDVLNRTWKGRLDWVDFNRIEENNGYLAQRLREIIGEIDEYRISKMVEYDEKYYPTYDHNYNPNVSIFWDAHHNPDGTQMLYPISDMLGMVGKTADLPVSLSRVNFIDINNIEKAQIIILNGIEELKSYYYGLIDDDRYTIIYGGEMITVNVNSIFGGDMATVNTNLLDGGTF